MPKTSTSAVFGKIFVRMLAGQEGGRPWRRYPTGEDASAGSFCERGEIDRRGSVRHAETTAVEGDDVLLGEVTRVGRGVDGDDRRLRHLGNGRGIDPDVTERRWNAHVGGEGAD